MDLLVSVVNKLQDALIMAGKDSFEFPEIVVVGDQSSGKSSVLESLVGKSFLPRGVGTVTRRPLLLRLETLKGEEEEDQVVFQHQPRVITDFREVIKEIEDETERAAGSNKGICSEPIVLTLHSRNAASNLTLVDLPGIVKVPTGDQPPDIEAMIHDLIIRYISNPNSIILAVVTANTDMATSEGLKIAREVDPNGERTLAVLTKLDIMDAGTNALDILTGNLIPVKLGIIGVVNRSQKDINEGKSIEKSVIEETDFFRKNYPMIAHKHGTPYLANRLQSLLIDHVKRYLPELKSKIQSALKKNVIRLKNLTGTKIHSSNQFLLQILTNFARTYADKIKGQSNELDTSELGGGARISYVFYEVFGTALDSVNPLESYSKEAILTAARNSSGAKPCIFLPETCFEILVKRQIRRLETPAQRCLELVYEEMEKILLVCINKSNDLIRFPKLSQKLVDICIKFLKSRIPETDKFIQNLIMVQSGYINTVHPDFKSVSMKFYSECTLPPTDVNSTTVKMIETLIITYFDIVKKTIQDMIPKTIMYFFVNYIIENILSELVNSLYSTSEQNIELLEESITIIEDKKKTAHMVESLEKANSIITDIQEKNFKS